MMNRFIKFPFKIKNAVMNQTWWDETTGEPQPGRILISARGDARPTGYSQIETPGGLKDFRPA
jgi:hypothetical protein